VVGTAEALLLSFAIAVTDFVIALPVKTTTTIATIAAIACSPAAIACINVVIFSRDVRCGF
jgi:hypothetical protein